MDFHHEILRLLHGDLGDSETLVHDYRFSDSGETGALRGSLAASFLKKLEPVGVNKKADKAALDLFISCNNLLPTDSYEFPVDSEADSVFWDYFKNNLNKTLGDTVGSEVFTNAKPATSQKDVMDPPLNYQSCQSIDLDFIRSHLNAGPGASIKANADSFLTKMFEGTISHYGSDYLIALYRAALVDTGLWCDAERLRNRKFGFTRVRGDNLFFAKKNADISRVCGTPALLESLFQKVCCAFAEMRLGATFGIYLDRQPLYNQQMAKRGSIDGTIGTIDLRSASDMQGLHMINKALDHCSFKTMINLCRSEFAVLPDGSLMKLNMMSMMGNGFTFPLQTIVFACAVRAVYTMMDLPSFDPKTQFGVFGDDICVRREAYTFLCRMLTKLGFIVNHEKSFNTGPFRESCGADFYNGRNIRGIYIKGLRTPQQVCSAINRLNRWSSRTGIELPMTISALRAMVPKAHLVPLEADDEAGIQVPFRCTIPKLDDNYYFLYRKWRAETKRRIVPEPDDSVNPFGTGATYLSGHTRRPDRIYGDFWGSDRIPTVTSPIRDKPNMPVRYKTVGDSSFFWNWNPPRSGLTAAEHDHWCRIVLDQQ